MVFHPDKEASLVGRAATWDQAETMHLNTLAKFKFAFRA